VINMEFEEKLLIEHYLKLTRELLDLAEQYINGKTIEVDFTSVEEILNEQLGIMNRLTFCKK
jgi:hypothetical protein